MKKPQQTTRLHLHRESVRVLTRAEVRRIAGGMQDRRTGGACCDANTELLDPDTGGNTSCHTVPNSY